MSLTFVPTPLGNLRDITLRAQDVLRDCALVVAEDTRVARRLLSANGIAGKRLLSYREQNAAAVTATILARAVNEVVAFVSDAGMPGFCDPGRELLNAARHAGIAVEVLPGPVAFVTAAVLSGFPIVGLLFGGFVPRAARQRERAFRAALESGATSVWYESPRRIVATLKTLDAIDPAATLFIVRELTKLHEQQILGTPREALSKLEEPVRGEITLVLAPRGGQPRRDARVGDVAPAQRARYKRRNESGLERTTSGDLEKAIDTALDSGLSVAAAAKMLARESGQRRSALYARISERKLARSGSNRTKREKRR